MWRCTKCCVVNAESMSFCGNCGSSVHQAGSAVEQDDRWQRIHGEVVEPLVPIGASDEYTSLRLATIVLMIGMALYAVGYLMQIIYTERAYSGSFDDSLQTIARLSMYTEGAGMIALFAGLVGVATGLSQAFSHK